MRGRRVLVIAEFVLADLDLAEDEMEGILDDIDAYPDEMLDSIVERLGIGESYTRATELAQVVP